MSDSNKSPMSQAMSMLGKKSWQARVEKMQASRKATKARHAQQIVTIDKDWRIRRLDEWNWEVQFKGKFKGYYGKITEALASLNGHMLGSEAKGSLNDLLALQKRLVETIEQAVKDARFLMK